MPHSLPVLQRVRELNLKGHRLERLYGLGHLHFITCSCYHRQPLLAQPRDRDLFLQILAHVRDRFNFALLGYVVMPEHIHLLISEPNVGNPSDMMKALKQRVSRALRRKRRNAARQLEFWSGSALERCPLLATPVLRLQRLERAKAQ